MHNPKHKKRSTTKTDYRSQQNNQSFSEPAFAKRIPLPPVAWSDLRKRRAKTDRYRSTLEPWHSSRVVDHSYLPSLDSLRVTEEYRRGQLLSEKQTVAIQGAELRNPPSSLFQMTELESLVLSPDKESSVEFRLDSIPKDIGNLRNLRQLVLDTNELTDVPEQLAELNHLDTLTLSNNRLTTMPEGFSKLSNLQSLHLANNRFTEIPPEICYLENLSFLDMSDNAIRAVPEDIDMLSLTLTMLFLYVNDLESLPDSFCNLTELTTLWLGKNRLTSLPEQFGDLINLDWAEFPSESNIDDNPLTTPPLQICRKGVGAIGRYFTRKKK